MANIFVSVPILGRPELKMMYSLYQSIFSCPEHNVRLYFNENDSLISRVRNCHITVFLNEYTDCDYFVSIDSDLEIVNCYSSNNIFKKFVSHDKDFVGGMYSLKSPVKKGSSSITDTGENEVKFDSGLVKMKWLSSGCWCIKRSAVQKMADAYPELIYDGDDNMAGKKIHGLYIPYIYNVGTKEQPFNKYLSEDWAFPVDPETNILCEGFVTKKIKDVNVGDILIGFDEEPSGQKRQLRFSVVEEKINKTLPRIKITTTNGIVITTHDHKWLTKRGKNNRFCGRKGRKNGNRINNPCKSLWSKTEDLKIGDFIYKPFSDINVENTDPYKYGYICGLWDGDGNVYKNKKWNSSTSSIRMSDLDILERCSEYLKYFGIENTIKNNVNINLASYNPEKHSLLHSIVLCGKKSEKIQNEILKKSEFNLWSENEDRDFLRGYLSGIFDSEGHYDGATIDLCQYKEVNLIVWLKIKRALEKLEIPHKSDKKRHRITKCKNVHDFLMLTTPACKRKLHINGQAKGMGNLIMPQYKEEIVNIEEIEEGTVMCITTETGTFIANGFASHNCNRWKDIGGEIYADTSIALKHYGSYPYTLWNFEVVKQPIENKQPPPQPEHPQSKPIKEASDKPINLPPAGYDLKGFEV